MPKLVEISASDASRVHPLSPGANWIGRGRGREISVSDESVSRRHACVDVGADGTHVTDPGSRNGTFVDGQPITGPTELTDGAELRCGDVTFQYLAEAAAPHVPQATAHAPRSAPVDATVLADAASSFLDASAPDRPERRLAVLRALTSLLTRSRSLPDLRQAIVDSVAQMLPVDRAVLIEVEATGVQQATAYHPAAAQGAAFSQHVVDHALAQKEAALFDDPRVDSRIGPAASVLELDLQAAMAAPLLADDQVLGALYVDSSRAASRFGPADLDLLVVVAGQAALALRNARLQQLRSTYDRYFPPSTIRRLLHTPRAELETTELVVTALFADISSFTTLCERAAPTDMVELLNGYFPPMARIVFERDGMLEKYIGDALLAAWGAPFPHDDDADRAVEAAVAMMRHARTVDVDIHIGVHTGPVAFGNIGSPEYQQLALIGDTTNLAARVCSEAPTGEIYVSAATVAACRRRWPLHEIGPRQVKGREAPVALFQLDWAAAA